MKYRGTHRERHTRGQMNLAVPVLAAALATLIISGFFLAGGVYGGASHKQIANPQSVSTPCLLNTRRAVTAAVGSATKAIRHSRLLSAASKIDAWLSHRGSPASGLGIEFVLGQERTGVSAALVLALFDKESTCGTAGGWSGTHHNGFGMHGPKNGIQCVRGMCWWPSWRDAIVGAFDFVASTWGPAQTEEDLRGYCEGNPPSWLRDVEYVREAVL